ncbi:MAG: hypothetical protein ACSLFM_03375 [Tepidiformaceae bacterium]
MDLKDFTACAWPTPIHDDRDSRGGVGVRAIAVESCQRFETFGVEPCTCAAPDKRTGLAALLRLASIAAGLESVVLGEAEILGQVKAAILSGPPELRPFGDLALASARELRREAVFNTHTGHLLDRAVELEGLTARGRLMIVGTGHVARQVASRAVALGFGEVAICGRTRPTTPWFSSSSCEFVDLGGLAGAQPADVLVTCLGPDAPRLDVDGLPLVRSFILDLGMPPNLAGTAAQRTHTVQSLVDAPGARTHSEEYRARLRVRLQEIVERRLTLARDDAGSPVGRVRLSVEQLRQKELTRFQRLYPEIPPSVLDRLTRSLVNSILHGPSERIKQADDPATVDALVTLFEPAARSRTARS